MTKGINGSWVYLMMKDESTGSFLPIGGQLNHSDTISVSLVDITNPTGGRYRTLLEGSGLLSRDVTVELVFSSDYSFNKLREAAVDRSIQEFKVLRAATGLDDDFKAKVLNLSDTSANGSQMTASISLAVTGEFGLANGPEIPGPPLITLHPQGETIFSPGKLLLYSRAINWDSVQWQRDGVDIPGASDINYWVEDPQENECYTAVYSNAYGSATTNSACLNILIRTTLALLSELFPVPTTEIMGISRQFSITTGSGVIVREEERVDISRELSVSIKTVLITLPTTEEVNISRDLAVTKKEVLVVVDSEESVAITRQLGITFYNGIPTSQENVINISRTLGVYKS